MENFEDKCYHGLDGVGLPGTLNSVATNQERKQIKFCCLCGGEVVEYDPESFTPNLLGISPVMESFDNNGEEE